MSSQSVICIWSIVTGKLLRRLVDFHTGLLREFTPTKLEFLPSDGNIIAAAGSAELLDFRGRYCRCKLTVWDCQQGKILSEKLTRRCDALTLVDSPSKGGRSKVMIASPQTIRFMPLGRGDVDRNPTISNVNTELKIQGMTTSFSPSRRYIAGFISKSHPAVAVMDVSTGKVVTKWKTSGVIRPILVSMSLDDEVIVSLMRHEGPTKETEIVHWNRVTGATTSFKLQCDHADDFCQRYAVSPDCSLVAICKSVKTIDLISPITGSRLGTITLEGSMPSDLRSQVSMPLSMSNSRGKMMAFSLNSKRMIISTRAGAEIWELKTTVF